MIVCLYGRLKFGYCQQVSLTVFQQSPQQAEGKHTAVVAAAPAPARPHSIGHGSVHMKASSGLLPIPSPVKVHPVTNKEVPKGAGTEPTAARRLSALFSSPD